MLEPKLQEALDKLSTLDLSSVQPIDTELTTINPFNGLSATDLYSMNTTSLPTLTTAQLGAIGQGYTISSGTAGSFNWQSPNTVWTTSATGGVTIPAAKVGTVELRGEDADIVVNGKSMMKLLERIEERLNLLEPNTELEKDWDDLRRLGERYRKLEKKCKEKAETWKKLKAMPPPQAD